ncbi:MAG TPA: LysE family transporter [Planctomycetota bacterium]|nr:LysE family transporter [Planctomycetota bacterium]
MVAVTFLKGLAVGAVIAAPVGPIGALCVRRTLAAGRRCGIVSGLGAATADAMYGAVAALGVNCVADFMIRQQAWLGIIGGAFLCCLGVKAFLAKPQEKSPPASRSTLLGYYASTLLLTLTNPLSIIAFVAIFASLGLASAGVSGFSTVVLILGVFLGSAMWWLLLSGSVGVFRGRFNASGLRWVNRISGVIIVCCGLLALTAGIIRMG